MAEGGQSRAGAGQALAQIELLLDRIHPDRSGLEPQARLELVKVARRVSSRIDALAGVLLAEADAGDASMRATRTPLSSWLGLQAMSKREAAAALHRAKELASHPQVGEAATAGRIGSGQARAIGRVLNQLAPQLDEDQQQSAETLLLDWAGDLDADQLAKAIDRVLAAVAPNDADHPIEARLQREHELARRLRALRLWRDGGSVRFDGSLPRVEGEAWISLLDAHAESLRRCALEERDPLATSPTPEQRRADALIVMVRQHQVTKQAPRAGGDRPRVMITVDYGRLRDEAAAAGLLGDQPISAGELRQLGCDADVLPGVLGGTSQPLDFGRETRVVPSGMRAALILRDGGCAFPTCHARAAVCEAHHIVPWWKGGSTCLNNLVLLCHHHHSLVEPDRYGMRDQWHIRITPHGIPELQPPVRYDREQRWLRHQRFTNSASEAEAGRRLIREPEEGRAAPTPETGGGSSRTGPPSAA